jgi:hypothetical protein
VDKLLGKIIIPLISAWFLAIADAAQAQPVDAPTPATADERDDESKEPLTIDPGEKRPKDQFRTTLFGWPLTIGGQYEFQPRYEEDFALDEDEPDDLAGIDQEIKVELFYNIADSVALFIQGKAFYEADLYAESGEREYIRGVGWSQTWLLLSHLFGTDFNVQLGRQKFADRRQWWWNDEVDSFRLDYLRDDIHAEIAVAEQLAVKSSDEEGIDPVREDLLLVLGDAIWTWAEKQELGVFFLSQFDHSKTEGPGEIIEEASEDDSDADLFWVGGRAFGKYKRKGVGKFTYWLDIAAVLGEETAINFEDADPGRLRVDNLETRDIRGWGLDVGLLWRTKLPFEPSIAMGYARGSADSNPDDGVDTAYRQSGLHRNRVKFEGEQRFRYYGELLRPELSNLEIWTFAIGVPLFESSSIDLLYHNYNQVRPDSFLRDTKLDAEPTGLDSDLGEEVDLIVSLDESEHYQTQFGAGLFFSGDAFGPLSGETAATLFLKLRYSF